MKGLLLTVIIEDELFMLEFFRTFRIGCAMINGGLFKATSLIIGFWKLESNLTFCLRKKLEWHSHGEA